MKNILLGLVLLIQAFIITGCQPRTPAEKAKDKVEDAAHETKQGIKRAADRVEDKVD